MWRNRDRSLKATMQWLCFGVVIGLGLLALSMMQAFASEAEIRDRWCAAHEGQAEFRLQDGTRVDCLTETHAVEVDFGAKWAESLGQSIHYGRITGKRSGVLLSLDEGKGHIRHVLRWIGARDQGRLCIDLWVIQDGGEWALPAPRDWCEMGNWSFI